MSVLFGMWNFDGKAIDPEYIRNVRKTIDPLSPDGVTLCVKGAFAMLYGAVHVTVESRREQQPAISPAGAFLMWDGRLDNRDEMRVGLNSCSPQSSDLEIISACWERKGPESLGRFAGDWALAVLNHYERTLILAKDFLGTRPLYYLRTERFVAWSSILAPLVLCSGERFTLSDKYLAGWLAGFPEVHLTPYKEICSVPPASFVRFTARTTRVETHSTFEPQSLSDLKSDADYEEQFRLLFFNAVRRRLRSATPVAAELSGGMDSSSIVCVADRLAQKENRPLVQTISFFDDAEPNWNERPYFASVESERGRTGFHLSVAGNGRFVPERDEVFPTTPAQGARRTQGQMELPKFLEEGCFRVLLSGVGGDEFTGGVPTGIPELADHLARGRMQTFLRRAFEWSLASRKPLVQVVGKTTRIFLPVVWRSASRKPWPMPWLTPRFLKENRHALHAGGSRFRMFGPLPTFQENLHALNAIQRQVACAEQSPTPICEKRYPFLDRDLLQFLFNIPREQLVRPGQRRSLLRRALTGIVPDLVLNRRRKAFVVSSHLKTIGADWENTFRLTENTVLESRDVLSSATLRENLEQARRGEEAPLLPIMRALRAEWWLQDPRVRNVLAIESCAEPVILAAKMRGAERA